MPSKEEQWFYHFIKCSSTDSKIIKKDMENIGKIRIINNQENWNVRTRMFKEVCWKWYCLKKHERSGAKAFK